MEMGEYLLRRFPEHEGHAMELVPIMTDQATYRCTCGATVEVTGKELAVTGVRPIPRSVAL